MEPREVAPVPRPQPHPAGEPIPSSPIEAAQDGESVPSAEAIAPSKRWAVIVGAFTVTAVLIVATVWFDSTQTPGSLGLALTGPTVPPASEHRSVDRLERTLQTLPPASERVGLTDLPPEGAVPSTPEKGRVVGEFMGGNYGWVFIYADGRVIWHPNESRIHPDEGGMYEQRLTRHGVNQVRSGALQPFSFLLYADSSVPASAWADPDIKAYVPSRYAVCYFMETGDANPGSINDGYEYPSTVAAHFGVLGFFPARVQDILRGKDHRYSGSPGPLECSEVTTDEARALAAILRGARVEDSEGDRIFWEFHALLPHGEWVETGG